MGVGRREDGMPPFSTLNRAGNYLCSEGHLSTVRLRAKFSAVSLTKMRSEILRKAIKK